MTSHDGLRNIQPESLQEARIKNLPSDAFYIPNFITPAEEEALLRKVNLSDLAQSEPCCLRLHTGLNVGGANICNLRSMTLRHDGIH